MGYFTSVADDLNSELPRTNPAGGSGQDFRGTQRKFSEKYLFRRRFEI